MSMFRAGHLDNISFDGGPIHIQATSDRLILIDPLALDGFSEQLAEIGHLSEPQQAAKLHELGKFGLRIGLHRLDSPGPVIYEVGLNAFEPADGLSHPGVFDIDSGTVVLIDADALPVVAHALTWERYDRLCQIGGDHIAVELIREIGGPRFAIISGDADMPFAGDGSYQLLGDVLRIVG